MDKFFSKGEWDIDNRCGPFDGDRALSFAFKPKNPPPPPPDSGANAIALPPPEKKEKTGLVREATRSATIPYRWVVKTL